MARIGIDLNLNQRSGLVLDPNEIDAPAHMIGLIKRAGVILEKNFPDWKWCVVSNANGAQIIITSARIDTEWGVHRNLPKIQADPTDSWARSAGAEYLERYGFHASGFRRQKDAYRNAPRNEKGVLIPDISDGKPSRLLKELEYSRQIATGQARMVTLRDGRKVWAVRK